MAGGNKKSEYRNELIAEKLDRVNLTNAEGPERNRKDPRRGPGGKPERLYQWGHHQNHGAGRLQGGGKMKIYTIIGGVNGVGKSSFTGVLKERSTDLGVIVDVDRITAELGGNALAGGKAALRKINDCIDKGISFTQETTLSGRKTEATAKQVKELGYHVRLFYIGLDTAEESLSRIANRVKRGGHDIPQDDVVRRFAGRWEAVSKVLPYCDEAEFYDNDNGFVLVAEYRNGELRTVGNRRPQWLMELLQYLDT